MRTIHCPKCRRALNLPEHADIATARCALCGTTFDVPSPEPEQPPVPVVPGMAHHSGVTANPLAHVAPRPPEPDEDYPGGPLTPADRAALRSAVSWLKAASDLVLVRTLACGCCPALLAGTRANGAPWVAVVLLVYVAGWLVVRWKAETLNRLSSRRWAVTVCSLAALAALVEMLLGLVAVWASLVELAGRGTAKGVLLVLAVALVQGMYIVVALVATIKAFSALRRPAVWHGFPLNRE
jgi:LSD1 subclass zinc finger protein